MAAEQHAIGGLTLAEARLHVHLVALFKVADQDAQVIEAADREVCADGQSPESATVPVAQQSSRYCQRQRSATRCFRT